MGIPNITRPCSFVFLRTDERLLVSEMFDAVEGTFYRPPGGGIEFGEHSRDAAVRELREEFDLPVDPHLLALTGVIENAFDFRDKRYHEICFIYEAWVDAAVLETMDGKVARDVPGGTEIAKVFTLSELLGMEPVYPDGVQEMLVPEG
jgi:ADP-ribose pyrophosphatase YjhB (NUDIX family)